MLRGHSPSSGLEHPASAGNQGGQIIYFGQGWGAGAGCFRLLEAGAVEKKPRAGATWKKSHEPEPLKN